MLASLFQLFFHDFCKRFAFLYFYAIKVRREPCTNCFLCYMLLFNPGSGLNENAAAWAAKMSVIRTVAFKKNIFTHDGQCLLHICTLSVISLNFLPFDLVCWIKEFCTLLAIFSSSQRLWSLAEPRRFLQNSRLRHYESCTKLPYIHVALSVSNDDFITSRRR